MMRIRVKINIHLNNKYRGFLLFLLHLVFIFNILVLVLGPGHVQTVKNCFSAPVTREQGGGPEDYIHLSCQYMKHTALHAFILLPVKHVTHFDIGLSHFMSEG